VQLCAFATAKPSKGNPTGLLKNEGIRYPSMRVVYKNESGESEWAVMTRAKALEFAKKEGLDLVLVNGKADPPVCKLEKFGLMLTEARKKSREVKAKQKARQMKEMFVTSGIEARDFATKMVKVKEFLLAGHSVKVSIVAKKFTKANRFKDGVRRDRMAGFDETTLMLLESIEDLPIVVQEQVIKKRPEQVQMEEAFAAREGGAGVGGAGVGGAGGGEGEEGDSDSDSEDEVVVGKPMYRPVTRREFLLTPKANTVQSVQVQTQSPPS
jgi:translation initiation factor IF-3